MFDRLLVPNANFSSRCGSDRNIAHYDTFAQSFITPCTAIVSTMKYIIIYVIMMG
jgi:hypothetical protein